VDGALNLTTKSGSDPRHRRSRRKGSPKIFGLIYLAGISDTPCRTHSENCRSMPSDLSSANFASAELHAFQHDLFPLDPWGAGHVVGIVERPCAGIARALIGPVSLGCWHIPQGAVVRCLAVAEDRTFASLAFLPQTLFNEAPGEFWTRVVDSITSACESAMSSKDPGMCRTPPDCVKSWSSPLVWIPNPLCGDPVHASVRSLSQLHAYRPTEMGLIHDLADPMQIEAQAHAHACEQIAFGVRRLLQALDPALFQILVQRPKLSITVAHQILCMAKRHSPKAVTYALQAMRTESQGLLHLIASDNPKKDAEKVREAVFSGQSLPDAFVSLGIAKAAHRKSLCKPVCRSEQWKEPEPSLSDLPMAGQDWLAAMRLTRHVPLHDKHDWTEFSRTVQLVLEQGFQKESTALQLLTCCTRPTVRGSGTRLERIISHARTLSNGVKGLANMAVTLDDVVSKFLETVGAAGDDGPYGTNFPLSLDAQDSWQLAAGVAQITGKSLCEILASLFDAHPTLPHSFVAPEHLSVYPLNSLDLVVAHGADCNTCLQHHRFALRYVTGGVALYGLRSGSEAVGTIAFQYDVSEDKPRVQVQEITTKAETDLAFCRLTRSLEDAFNTDQAIPAWVAYQDQCAQWRRRATSAS